MTQLPELPLSYLHLPCTNASSRIPLFMLHGYGSNREDLFSFASDLNSRYEIFSLQAPLPMHPFGFAWYQIDFEAPKGKWSNLEQARSSLHQIDEFVSSALEAFGLEDSRIALLGFSQGCILSFAYALQHPERVGRVIGLSGYVNEQLLPSTLDANRYESLQVYSSHGTEDPVIPVEWARKTPDFFRGIGKEITYEEFPSGHGVDANNYRSFVQWALDS